MTTPDAGIPVTDPEWVDFIQRTQKIISTRLPGSPVVIMIPQMMGEREASINLLAYQLQPFHYPLLMLHMADSFARNCPQLPAAHRIKALCDKLLGTIQAQDISRGRT